MTLKVKFANFELISRSRTVAGLIDSRGELELVTSNSLKTIFPTKKAARLLGVSISGFVDASPRFRFLCFGVRQVLRRYFPEAAQQKDCRMAHVFVTGSADGLGKMAAELLIEQGHKVVLHARSAARADEIRKTIAGAEEDIVVGDLASIAETRSVADQVNKFGRFDAVIHNAGIRPPRIQARKDGRWSASTLRREHSGSVHPDRPHHDTETVGLPVLRNALRRRIATGRHAVGKTPVEWLPSLRRDKVSGCARIRGGAAVSRREVEFP